MWGSCPTRYPYSEEPDVFFLGQQNRETAYNKYIQTLYNFWLNKLSVMGINYRMPRLSQLGFRVFIFLNTFRVIG